MSQGTQQHFVHDKRLNYPLQKTRLESCKWQNYKLVNLHESYQEAFFYANERLVEWVNNTP